jgi:hypothetical protein
VLGVQSLLHAAKVAAAWLISMGPIALVVAAVVGLVAVVIKNWETIKNAITAAVNVVLGFLRANWPLILAIITGPIGLAVLAIAKNWDTIKGGVTAVKDWIVARFNDIVGFVTGLPGRISSAAKGMWDGIAGAFKAAVNTIIRGWNAIEFKIPGFKVGPVGFDEFVLGVPDIKPLARGGRFDPGFHLTGERGPELALFDRPGFMVNNARLADLLGGGAPVFGGDLVLNAADMTPADVSAELSWWARTSGR